MSKLNRFKKKYSSELVTPRLPPDPLKQGVSLVPAIIPLTKKGSTTQSTGVKNKITGVISSINLIKANTKLVPRSHKMSREMTEAECHIWFNLLSKKQLLGYKFTKQKIIFNYILDFYCSELLLAIEIDGLGHNQKLDYDKTRDDFLKSIGITIIRIKNHDVLNNLDGVKAFLENQINQTNS